MKEPRFILHGIEGLYNYGCEAIVRGTYKTIREKYPRAEVLYLSQMAEYDKKRIDDLEIEVIDNFRPMRIGIISRIFRKLQSIVYRKHFHLMSQKFLDYKKGDILLSIGGDIFTLPTLPYPRVVADRNISIYRYAKKHGARVILWAASVGPFEAWPAMKKFYRKQFSVFDLVAVREEVTRRYLEKELNLGVKIVKIIDPAFLLSISVKEMRPRRFDVGINLSPLSIEYSKNEKEDISVIVQRLTEMLENSLMKRPKLTILFIPHVWSNDPRDNDYALLRTIFNSISIKYPDRVSIISQDLGALYTKGQISSCNHLIAARMHCALAAISLGIPTVMLSYSSKSLGMADELFGNRKSIFTMREILDTGFEKPLEYLQNNNYQEINKDYINIDELANNASKYLA